jgi:hypothetical protein
MNVPCPVPLQSPWSPVGYQVVVVSDLAHESIPEVRPPTERTAGGRSRRGPSLPSSGVGYRVAQIAEERIAGPARAPLTKVRSGPRRPPKKMEPLVIWAPVAAVGGFLMVLLAGRTLSLPERTMPPDVAFAHQPNLQVHIPEALQVNLPAEVAANGDAGEQPPIAAAPVVLMNLADRGAPPADEKLLPKEQACVGNDAGRETFGTAVAFARNPREAARHADAERKLVFLLHVSGNFEDARFT